MYHSKVGDLYFPVCSKTAIDMLVKLGSWAVYEKAPEVGHVGIVSDVTDRLIIEQTYPRQRQSSFDKHEHYQIWTDKRLRHSQRLLIKDIAERELGNPYPMWKNILFGAAMPLSWLLAPIVSLIRGKKTSIELPLFYLLHTMGRSFVCSQTVARYYWLVGEYDFGKPWWACKPDDIHDFVSDSPHYERVE
jgi:hypothetical protein